MKLKASGAVEHKQLPTLFFQLFSEMEAMFQSNPQDVQLFLCVLHYITVSSRQFLQCCVLHQLESKCLVLERVVLLVWQQGCFSC